MSGEVGNDIEENLNENNEQKEENKEENDDKDVKLNNPDGDVLEGTPDNKAKKKKIIIISIIAVFALLILIVLLIVILRSKSTTIEIDGKKVEYKSVNYITKDYTINSGEFKSTSEKETVFLVTNGATLTISDAKIYKKTSGNNIKNFRRLSLQKETELKSDDPPPKPSGEDDPPSPGPSPPSGGDDADQFSFYGTNSAIVVIGENSKVIINNCYIETDSNGANAIVAVNKGSVDIRNSQIVTSNDGSRGLHATFKGYIKSHNVTISTVGRSCANLATDRGEGTVEADNMTLSTAGAGSPLIYSTGNITVTNSSGTSTGAQISVIEGKNSINIKDCDFKCNGNGNRGNADIAGVMIYQSMSGDADIGVGTFNVSSSNLTILSTSEYYKDAPLFFITNTDARINLEDTLVDFGSSYYVLANSTSEWGKEGSNGGRLIMKTTKTDVRKTLYAGNNSYIELKYDSFVDIIKITTEGNVTLTEQ